jgi:restriction system protein
MVGVPTHDQLLNPTLKALRSLGGSVSTTELLEQIIEDLQSSKVVIEQPHPGKSNQTELGYRLAWSRTYLKKYGLITNSARGVLALTSKGGDLKTVDPRVVVQVVREQSHESSLAARDRDESILRRQRQARKKQPLGVIRF